MTLDQVFDYVHVDSIYSYAHDHDQDLIEVVRMVFKRSMAVDEGLDTLAEQTGIARADLDDLLNWFDVFEYSVAKKAYLVDVMKLALETHGSHLLNKEPHSISEDENRKLKREAFDIELQRLQHFKSIPDGRASRSEQREDRARKNREKKLNKSRGFFL